MRTPSSTRNSAVLEGHTSQVLAAAFNTNATQVVSGGADRQLKVWDIATREKIVSLGSHAAGITAVVWPTNGISIEAVTEKGEVFRYTNLKSHSGEQSSASADERRIGSLDTGGLSLAVSPDGRHLYAGGHDGTVRMWNKIGPDGTLAHLADEWTRGNYPRSFTFSPTSQFLYCCNQRADNVTQFQVDPKSGQLHFTGHFIPVGNPSHIVFLDLAKTS